MIDLHAHILPDADDGSPNVEESLKMLTIAVQDGITAIVATPHVFSALSKIRHFNKLPGHVKKLKKAVEEANLKIKVYSGAEVSFDSSFHEILLQNPKYFTINHGRYFLLEFPSNFIFPGSKQFLFDIMTEGYIPIICHPERNQIFQESPQQIIELLQGGVMAQANAGSFVGDFGTAAQSMAFTLLRRNLIHVIASDCHNSHRRCPRLSYLYKELEFIGKPKLDLLLNDIPDAIINNKPIPDIGPASDEADRPKSGFLSWLSGLFSGKNEDDDEE